MYWNWPNDLPTGGGPLNGGSGGVPSQSNPFPPTWRYFDPSMTGTSSSGAVGSGSNTMPLSFAGSSSSPFGGSSSSQQHQPNPFTPQNLDQTLNQQWLMMAHPGNSRAPGGSSFSTAAAHGTENVGGGGVQGQSNQAQGPVAEPAHPVDMMIDEDVIEDEDDDEDDFREMDDM